MSDSDIWTRYDEVMKRHAPQTFERFRPPASSESIATAEKAIGVTFPSELRAAYARHDGFTIFQRFLGNSLEEMTTFWKAKTCLKAMLEIEDELHLVLQQPTPDWAPLLIRPIDWHEEWIPIASDGISSHCVDMAPGPKGVIGQLIMGSDSFHLTAPSLNVWVTFLLDCFESGRFVEDPSKGECHWVDTKFGDLSYSNETFAFYGKRGLR